jgi:hypothetical protein
VNKPAALPLRDIHLPSPVSWWPPAPGWWLLAGLVLGVGALIWWWRRRRRRIRFAAVTLARGEFQEIAEAFRAHKEAPEEIVRQLSVLLRRLSISLFPRAEAAGLTGEAWLAFLDRPLQRAAFSGGEGRILAEAPYRPEVQAEEVEPLLALTREWIDAVARTRREVRP